MPYGKGEAIRSLQAVTPTALTAGISYPAGGTPWEGEPADYYPWLDFGGSTGRGHEDRVGGSGSIQRPVVAGGRYLYPAIAESMHFVTEFGTSAIVKVAQRNGFEVR